MAPTPSAPTSSPAAKLPTVQPPVGVVSRRGNYTLPIGQRIYLIAIFKGMLVTAKHLFRNLLNPRKIPTIQYPEQRRAYSARFRGLQILTVKESGDVRCTACMLCATACPAECIHITAGEHPNKEVEKYPVEFNIDMLRCVFCGMCEEACPVDAIRMGPSYELASFDRSDFIYTKEDLIKLGNYTVSKVKDIGSQRLKGQVVRQPVAPHSH